MSFTPSLRCAVLALATLAMSASSSRAEVITLENHNSVAIFHTEASDGGRIGLNAWIVDDVNHLHQQWFWHRVGSHTREWAIDGTGPLVHVNSNALDLDGDLDDDFLIAEYNDSETVITPERYNVQFRYLLTGGTADSNTSDIVEVIRIRNTGTQPLEFHLFQYVDFDLNDDPDNDRVVLSGTPINTATQSDPINIIGETVVTPPPQRYEVDFFDETLTNLEDGDIDNLANTAGPLAGDDVTWAFQWDFAGILRIPAGGVALISKDKNIRPGEGGIIPEPSTYVLACLGVAGLLWSRRRRA
jgi:hypothetical protein